MKAAALLVALVFAIAGPFAIAQDEAEKPAEKQDELDARISKLVEQLGSDTFKDREAATEELKKIGKPAVPALIKALKSEDLEVRLRAESILKGLRKDSRARDGRPTTADPRRGPATEPRPGEEWDEILKGLPKEQREMIEKMLKEMDLELPRRLFPKPGEDKDESLLPDEVRKAFEEMEKNAEEARKRFDRFRRRIEELEKEEKPEEPRTEPREEDKPDQAKKPPTTPRGEATIVLKRLRWKDGKLVEEEEYKHDSELPGLFVTDRGEVLRALRYHLELGENEGVLVDSVKEDGPFHSAGIREHDIITKVDGKLVDSRNTLAGLLKNKERVTIEAIRKGKRKSFTVELADK